MKTKKLIIALGQGPQSDFLNLLQFEVDNRCKYLFNIASTINLPFIINDSDINDIIIIEMAKNPGKAKMENLEFQKKFKTNLRTIIFFEINSLHDLSATMLDFGVVLGKSDHLFPGLYSFNNGEINTIN